MYKVARIGRMLMTGTAVLALSVPLTQIPDAVHPGFIRPAEAANVEISFFYDRLAAHGSWVDHGRYGYVFVPAVGRGWRPYVHGHWVYTDRHGWYWVSDEPFSWAVYHYGRWAYDPVYGWIWVPGNVWGPAWVTWRHGGGHVGWAPMGPHGRGYVYGTPDYYDPPVVEAWVFVPERRFVAVDVARYVRPVVEINIFLGKSRERHHAQYRDGRAYNPFLPRDRVRGFVNRDIAVFNIGSVDDPDQVSKKRGKGDERTIRVFRADIAEKEPKQKPSKVARTPDEVKSKPTLEETAKGEKPEGAPPSAAELKPDDADRPDSRKAKGKAESETESESQDKAKRESESDKDQPARARTEDETGDKPDSQSTAKPETPQQKKTRSESGQKKQAEPKDKDKGKPKPEQKQAEPDAKPQRPADAKPKSPGKPPAEAQKQAPKPKPDTGKKQSGDPQGGGPEPKTGQSDGGAPGGQAKAPGGGGENKRN